MRVVIGGDEETAVPLAEALMATHEVVIVADEGFPRARLDRLDVEFVAGSISSPDALTRAGAAHASFFVACAREDERNLIASVTAKRLGAEKTVGLFRRPEYVRPLVRGEASIASAFGIDTVIWPAERLAREIVQIVSVPGALDVEVLEGGRVRMRKYPVEAGARFAGKTLREAGVPRGVVLVGHRRAGGFSLPRGDTRLEPGDKVIAMGDLDGLDRLAASVLRGDADRGGGVTVIGGGTVGQRVAHGLAEAGGREIKIIESDRARCEELASALPGALVLCGSGTDTDLLESERVDLSRVLVAVTDNDEKNLLVSLLARQLGVARIVTRAGSIPNERLFERVGIDVVRSARGSAVRAVVDQITGGRSGLRAEVEHGEARIVEMTVPVSWDPVRLERLHLPVFAIVGAIVRDGRTIIPRGGDEIRGGDRVLVFCEQASEASMRHVLSRPKAPEV